MASPKISMALKLKLLFFFAVLFIAFTVSATDMAASFHKPHIRKLSVEHRTVEKAAFGAKPAASDFPWKGGYKPPINNR